MDELLSKKLNREIFNYGFADLRGLLPQKYSDYPSGISIMRKMDDRIIDNIRNGPTMEYFNLYHSVNNELNETVALISKELTDMGIENAAIKSTTEEKELTADYSKTLTYPISHKMIATRSGLGWIGKTDLFISTKFGPRLRLASILVKADLTPDHPVFDESQCGSCKVCVVQCPAQAANGKLWSTGTHRDTFFDAFKCMAYCKKITTEKIHQTATICGKCIAVCPKGKMNNEEN